MIDEEREEERYMIQFRVSTPAKIEWTQDNGRTWHDQNEPTPKDVLSAWWALMVAIGMQQTRH